MYRGIIKQSNDQTLCLTTSKVEEPVELFHNHGKTSNWQQMF
jgi:hypothetical protein